MGLYTSCNVGPLEGWAVIMSTDQQSKGKRNEYLLQRSGSCCAIFSLCNALRYFGRPSPEPGNEEWEALIDFACCRNGSALRMNENAKRFGLRRTRCSWEEIPNQLPVVIPVPNPEEVGSSYHSVLVIGTTDTHWTLVNYRWVDGPVVEKVPVEEIVARAPSRCFYPMAIELM